ADEPGRRAPRCVRRLRPLAPGAVSRFVPAVGAPARHLNTKQPSRKEPREREAHNQTLGSDERLLSRPSRRFLTATWCRRVSRRFALAHVLVPNARRTLPFLWGHMGHAFARARRPRAVSLSALVRPLG